MNNEKKKFIYKTFNTEFTNFLDFIISLFPDKDELKSFKTAITFLIKYNPSKLIYLWNYYVTIPYNDIIQKGDFNYFENKNYSTDVKDLKENAEYVLKTYNEMRENISKTSEENKKISMKYIQNLSNLSLLYYS